MKSIVGKLYKMSLYDDDLLINLKCYISLCKQLKAVTLTTQILAYLIFTFKL